MKIHLEKVRELLREELEILAITYPDERTRLEQLSAKMGEQLSVNDKEMEQVFTLIGKLTTVANELEVDGYAYGSLFTVRNACQELILREASNGQAHLPGFEVSLKRSPEASTPTAKQLRANQGKRTKIGGQPNWLQGPQPVLCRRCDKVMIFVAQIDSLGAHPEADERGYTAFMFGDCGMIYVFWCPTCNETQSCLQCA